MAQVNISQTLDTPQITTNPNGYDYDLVIVGGGIVGLTLASSLKDSVGN